MRLDALIGLGTWGRLDRLPDSTATLAFKLKPCSRRILFRRYMRAITGRRAACRARLDKLLLYKVKRLMVRAARAGAGKWHFSAKDLPRGGRLIQPAGAGPAPWLDADKRYQHL